MTEMQMPPEQARIVFDAVLRIDLQNGTYKTASPCTGEETPGENGAYAEWAGRLTKNADGENAKSCLRRWGLKGSKRSWSSMDAMRFSAGRIPTANG